MNVCYRGKKHVKGTFAKGSHRCVKQSPCHALSLPSLSFSSLSFPRGVLCCVWISSLWGRHLWGMGTAKACTTNSAHERLMQQEQLSSIVSLQISNVPHFASQCVSSKTEPRRGKRRGNKPKWEGRLKKKPSGQHRKFHRFSSMWAHFWASFSVRMCRGCVCVVGPWSNNKPWTYSDPSVCSM